MSTGARVGAGVGVVIGEGSTSRCTGRLDGSGSGGRLIDSGRPSPGWRTAARGIADRGADGVADRDAGSPGCPNTAGGDGAAGSDGASSLRWRTAAPSSSSGGRAGVEPWKVLDAAGAAERCTEGPAVDRTDPGWDPPVSRPASPPRIGAGSVRVTSSPWPSKGAVGDAIGGSIGSGIASRCAAADSDTTPVSRRTPSGLADPESGDGAAVSTGAASTACGETVGWETVGWETEGVGLGTTGRLARTPGSGADINNESPPMAGAASRLRGAGAMSAVACTVDRAAVGAPAPAAGSGASPEAFSDGLSDALSDSHPRGSRARWTRRETAEREVAERAGATGSSGPAEITWGAAGAARPETWPLGPPGSTAWPSGARKLGLRAVTNDPVKASRDATGRAAVTVGRNGARSSQAALWTGAGAPETAPAFPDGGARSEPPRLHHRATGHLPRSIRVLMRPISSANRRRSACSRSSRSSSGQWK